MDRYNNRLPDLFSMQYIDNTCFETMYPAYKVHTESSEIMPIALSTVTVTAKYEMDDKYGDQENDLVEAKIVVPSIPTTSVGSYDCTEQDLTGFSQPIITYCQVRKPDDGSSLGITFKRCSDNKVRISSIDPDSPFARPMCLKPGDEVVAINGLSPINFSSDEMLDVYATNNTSSSNNNVSVTVWNPNGDPNTFMNSVQVPTIDCKLGITLQNEQEQYCNGRLCIYQLAVDGAFGSSLLGPGHQVVAINNIPCSYIHCRDAVHLLRSTNGVTVSHDNGILYHHKNILSRIPIGCKNTITAIVLSQEPITNNSSSPNLFRRRFGFLFHTTDKILSCLKK